MWGQIRSCINKFSHKLYRILNHSTLINKILNAFFSRPTYTSRDAASGCLASWPLASLPPFRSSFSAFNHLFPAASEKLLSPTLTHSLHSNVHRYIWAAAAAVFDASQQLACCLRHSEQVKLHHNGTAYQEARRHRVKKATSERKGIYVLECYKNRTRRRRWRGSF